MDEAVSILYKGIHVLLALLEKENQKGLVPSLSALEREEGWEKPLGLTDGSSTESELTSPPKKKEPIT